VNSVSKSVQDWIVITAIAVITNNNKPINNKENEDCIINGE
jgi:hypothetical protein